MRLQKLGILLLFIFILSGCSSVSSLTKKDIVIMDVRMDNVLVEGADVVFKAYGNTYVAKGEASKYKTILAAKKADFAKFDQASDAEKEKMKVSWFVRFADYNGKIVLMQ